MPVYSLQHHRTRELFLSVGEGFVRFGTLDDYLDYAEVEGGVDLDEPKVHWTMKVPDDFVSFSSLKAMWFASTAVGNMYWNLNARYGTCGEHISTHFDTPALGVTATGGNLIKNCQEPANPLTLADLAIGDSIGISFTRQGTDALDTLDIKMYLLGLLFTYVGHQ